MPARPTLPWLALPFLLLAAPAARSEETAPTPAQALVAELDAAKAARDETKWIAALAKVGEVYKAAGDADKKPLCAAAAAALKSKAELVQVAAIDALVATGDGDAAWKAGLKGALPDVKSEAATTAELKALEAAKALKPEAGVAALLTLVEKGKDPKAAAGALAALGAYERSKQRVAILEALIKTLRAARPGRNPQSGAMGNSPRWDALDPAAVPSLNELTGQKLADFDAWLALYEEHKKKPAGLFTASLD